MKISSLLKAIGVCTLIANSSLTFAAENNTSNHKILIAYFSFPLPFQSSLQVFRNPRSG